MNKKINRSTKMKIVFSILFLIVASSNVFAGGKCIDLTGKYYFENRQKNCSAFTNGDINATWVSFPVDPFHSFDIPQGKILIIQQTGCEKLSLSIEGQTDSNYEIDLTKKQGGLFGPKLKWTRSKDSISLSAKESWWQDGPFGSHYSQEVQSRSSLTSSGDLSLSVVSIYTASGDKQKSQYDCVLLKK
jgi:hypothetical protein